MPLNHKQFLKAQTYGLVLPINRDGGINDALGMISFYHRLYACIPGGYSTYEAYNLLDVSGMNHNYKQ